MRKLGFVACFFFAFLIMTNTALAKDEVKISLNINEITTYIGEIADVDVTIQNNQNTADTFLISVFPSFWYNINVILQEKVVNLNAKSSGTIKIYFDARLSDVIISPFNITVRSINNENFADSGVIKLTVLRRIPIYVSDIKSSNYFVNPGETITIESDISNSALNSLGPFNIQTSLKYGDLVLKKFDDYYIDSISQSSVKKIRYTYTFDKYAGPGNYYVETIIKDENNVMKGFKISDPINLNEINKLVQEKSTAYSLVTQTVTIKIKNEGNVLASNFHVTESVPQFMKNLFYPQVEPVKEEGKDGRVVYYWLIDRLSPGQEKTIKYEIRSTNIVIILILLIVFVIIAFRYVFSPKIVKKVKHAGALTREKEVVVSVEAKNRSRHEIKNVTVRDFIPSIATLIEKFDTIKPNIRRTEGGTELIWRFDSFRPFEERVLTYRIRPIIEIGGTLKLPKARVFYMDKKREKKTTASKSILIKSG